MSISTPAPVLLGASPSSPDRPASGRGPAVVAAVLALVVYAITLRGTYIYDDCEVARDDPRLVSPAKWSRYWTQPYMPGGLDKTYRPLTSMTFAVEQWLHGPRPWAFHLVNILLHAGASAAVAVLAARLAGSATAFVAGALFAIHPVHTDAVASLVGRAEPMCLLSMFIGLCLFIRPPLTMKKSAAIMASFPLALLSKEQGMLFPLFILALVPLRRRRDGFPRAEEKRAAFFLAGGLLWMLAVYGILREQLIGTWWNRGSMYWIYNPLIRSVGLDRVLLPVALLGRYLSLLVAPVRLSPDYTAYAIGWQTGLHDPYLYVGVAAVVSWIAVLAYSLRRRNMALLFGAGAMAVSYLLISNGPMIISTIFAERLIYLPSAFFLIVIGSMLARARPSVWVPLVGVLVILGGWRTVRYARQWNDRMRFYDQSLDAQPGSIMLYYLSFDEHAHRGEWREARAVAVRGSENLPDLIGTWEMLIESSLKLGDVSGARQALARARKAYSGDSKSFTYWQRQIDAAETGKAPPDAQGPQSR
ncbi:MAG: Tetratricopeptide 2 repeat protein [Phycisphaerales bacterium]|nr:Tetratricopeptide 2 repeat protein [Phycisphaerales bacterium]